MALFAHFGGPNDELNADGGVLTTPEPLETPEDLDLF